VVDEPASGLGGEEREAVVGALVWARERGCAVLCGTSDPTFAEMLVDSGARRVQLEDGHVAGAPPIGLVPASMHSSGEHAAGIDEADSESGERPVGERRSSSEESS
jgi:hypothetical protein